jgi:hypothetical protein
MNKHKIYDDQIQELSKSITSSSKIAKIILNKSESSKNDKEVDNLRKYIDKQKNLGIYEEAENFKIDLSNVKDGWLKSKTASFRFSNPTYKDPQLINFEKLKEELITELQSYSPKFPKLERIKDTESYLLVIDPADIHIGKLCSAFESGETYNNQIAVQRVLQGVKGILNKVQGFSIDKILFIGGNDILHIDNPKRTTTSGTPQDTDGMWHSNFLIAKQLYIDILEILIGVADVHFTFNPSNHDYTNGFFLAQVVETYFRNCENITFDCSIAHRKGFKYYNNLIGTTHGDGAKQDLLPLLMATEFSREWAETQHRYIYTHHLHHKTSKDYIGITVESLRSPSGTDSWHHRNGYQHAKKAVEGFLHHKENGQIARITHNF